MKAQPTRVVAIEGTVVTVAVEAAGACGGCRTKAACGSGHGSTHRIDVGADVVRLLRAGDQVSVTLDDGATLRAVAAAYLMPLCGLLGGIAAGSAAGLPDAAVIVCGCSGLLTGYVASRLLARRWRAGLQPQVCGGGS